MSELEQKEPIIFGLEYLEDGGDVNGTMEVVVRGMNKILNSSPTLTWDDFYKIYGQWYELQRLIDSWIDIRELKMYDAFCEATRKNLIRKIGSIDNTKDFIRLILFIEDFRKVSSNSSLMDKFRWYLPDVIPQEIIDSAQKVWKSKMLSGEYPYSGNPQLFFREKDIEGYCPDLDYLRFFHERATEDNRVSWWYDKFKLYIRPNV